MKFLSARRRHPLAGLVVVLFGLLLAGAAYSGLRPAIAEDEGVSDDQLIEQGRQLFTVSCSSCHGLNGEGIPTKSDGNYGPPLIGVGAAAVDFQVGTGRMPMARPDTQAAQREVMFSDEEIEALAAFVASLGPGPSVPSEDKWDTSDASVEDIVAGGGFFRTNCTACHNFNASGGALPHGRFAPPLLNVEPKYIYEAMLTGPQQMPVFSDGVLSPDEKRQVIAYIRTLAEQPSFGGHALGSLGPVSEGLWGWVLGIGVLVLVTTWIGNHGVRAGVKKR